MHYLDNAASTKPCEAAVSAAVRCMTDDYGNPSSRHAAGRAARDALTLARAQVSGALGAQPDELVFTGGGTEACNLALLGAGESLRRTKGHIVTSALEHAAVMACCKHLQLQGFALTVVAPDASGHITPDAVLAALRPDTVLVSVMLVSNDTGACNPVADIVRAVRQTNPGVLFHTDAVQAFLKVPCAPRDLGVDLLSVSAHKIGGLKGAGALWRSPAVRLAPRQLGGGHEGGLRSGTEALPAIAAFGAACAARSATFAQDVTHMNSLKEHLLRALGPLPGAVILPPHEAPHIVTLSLPGYPSEVLVRFLSDRGVCVSSGSACHKGKRSEALAAMGLPSRVLDSTLRVSVCQTNTREDIDALLAGLAEAVKTLAHR